VLFVSHNLGAVRKLCARVVLLDKGRLEFDGPTELGLARYEASAAAPGGAIEAAGFTGPLASEIRFGRFVLRQEGREVALVDPALPTVLEVAGEALRPFSSLDVAVGFFRDGHRLFSCHDGPPGQPLPQGPFRSTFEIPGKLLRPGRYSIGFGAHRPGLGDWAWSPHAALFEVSERWLEGLDARDEGALAVAYRGSRETG
jgi:hypothetical protein